MFNHRESLISQHTASWTWHVMPALICLAVVSALFLPRATPSAQAAADLVGIEEAHHATLLVPAAQPGEGEPALVVSHLPQWY
jgi:hypothetical protein